MDRKLGDLFVFGVKVWACWTAPWGAMQEGPDSSSVAFLDQKGKSSVTQRLYGSAFERGVGGRETPGELEEWATVYEALPVPALLLDEEERIVVDNDAACSLFDTPFGELRGSLLDRFLVEGQVVRRARGRRGLLRDMLRIGGLEVRVILRTNPVRVCGKEWLVVLIEDRTAEFRRRAERSSSIPPSSLFEGLQDKLHLARHFEALGHLTSTVIHDLNNLLTVVRASLDAAERRAEEGGDVRKDLARARLATERSIELGRSTLRYSRTVGAPYAPTDVCELVLRIRELLERVVAERGSLVVELEACPPVLVCPAQLETALLNLVINARDALKDSGTVTVKVHAHRVAELGIEGRSLSPGTYCSLSVSDDGAGIPAAIQSKIFEPFFSTKAEDQGTGLGLSSVRALVRSLGGVETVVSSEGKGTTIELLLPTDS